MIVIDISDLLIAWAIVIPTFYINQKIVIWGYKRSVRKRGERFLRIVQIENPNATITFISASSDDEKALKEIEQKYREVR